MYITQSKLVVSIIELFFTFAENQNWYYGLVGVSHCKFNRLDFWQSFGPIWWIEQFWKLLVFESKFLDCDTWISRVISLALHAIEIQQGSRKQSQSNQIGISTLLTGSENTKSFVPFWLSQNPGRFDSNCHQIVFFQPNYTIS